MLLRLLSCLLFWRGTVFARAHCCELKLPYWALQVNQKSLTYVDPSRLAANQGKRQALGELSDCSTLQQSLEAHFYPAVRSLHPCWAWVVASHHPPSRCCSTLTVGRASHLLFSQVT